MTYTDNLHNMEQIQPKPPTNIAKAVKSVLVQAFQEDRVSCGVFDCVDILDRDTDNVMLCILPEGKSQDISLRIQHTLIEAFCRENEVKVIKVDCPTKISTIFTATVSKETKERTYNTDFSCVLVMNPKELSKEDEFLTGYCENFMLGGVIPHGNIELPV